VATGKGKDFGGTKGAGLMESR
jgi:hypothetical protein